MQVWPRSDDLRPGPGTGGERIPAVEADNAALQISSVSKNFTAKTGTVCALADVTLSLARGELGAIVGPSGCGKSTLLRLIADIMSPSSGGITIGGEAPAKARLRHQIGFVFQQPTLLPWRSVRDNIRLPRAIAGGAPASDAPDADELIKLVQLEGFADMLPAQLSGGMQQRVAIARALILQPSLLLLDEPFGALDEITRQHMNLELLRIWASSHTTALLVTHSIAESVFMADRVYVMSDRPGTILDVITIDLPRPRDVSLMREQAFFRLVNQVRDALYGRAAALSAAE